MKTKLLSLLLLLGNLVCLAQTNNNQAFEWAINTKAGANSIKQIKYDPSGNMVVLGTVSMKGKWGNTDIPTSPKFGQFPGTGVYIGKISQTGTQTLLKSFNNTAVALSSYLIDVDLQGNIYLLGSSKATTASPVDFGNGITINSNGYFLLKMDGNGNALWAKTYQMGVTTWNAFTNPSGLKVIPTGEIYLSLLCPNAPSKYWLLKVNNQGNEIWHRESLTNATDPYKCATSGQWVDEAGNSFIVKYSPNKKVVFGSDSVVASGAFGPYLFVVGFDPNGNKKWMNAYNRADIVDYTLHPKTSEITMILVQTGANAAPFDSLIFTGLPYPSSFQGLVRTTINGVKLSYQPFAVLDSIKIGEPSNVITLSDGNLAVASRLIRAGEVFIKGQSLSIDNKRDQDLFLEFGTNLKPKYFIALQKADASSEFNIACYQNKIGVSGNAFVPKDSILIINKTTLYAGSNEPTFATEFPIFADSRQDVYITQFDRSLQAGSSNAMLETNLQPNHQVFPNPFSNALNITSTHTIQEVTIMNASGQMVFQQNIQALEVAINLEELPQGVYIALIKTNQGVLCQKIIKQ